MWSQEMWVYNYYTGDKLLIPNKAPLNAQLARRFYSERIVELKKAIAS